MKPINYRKVFSFIILLLYLLVAMLIVVSSIFYITNQINVVDFNEPNSIDPNSQISPVVITPTVQGQDFLEKIAVPIILYILTFLYEPLRESLKSAYLEFISLFVFGKYCRIFIFGERRSGKSTLIENILTKKKPTSLSSTKEFHLYKGATKDNLNGKTIGIFIADYAGEKQYQVLQNPPEIFFGSPNSPSVNAIIFLVDLFPSKVVTENPREPDKTREATVNELLSEYDAINSMQKIKERLALNEEYLSTHSILSALAASFKERNATVKFVVNKMDILQELLIMGYIKDESGKTILSAKDFATQIYAPLKKKVFDICEKVSEDNEIRLDFDFHFISAFTGDGVNEVVGSIIENYLIEEGKKS